MTAGLETTIKEKLENNLNADVEYSVDEILTAADYDSMDYTSSVYVVAVEGRLQKFEEHTVGFIETAVNVTKNYTGPKIEYLIGAGLMKVNSGETPLDTIDFTVFGAEVSAFAGPTCLGYGAKLVFAGGRVSAFDVNLGLGVSSAIGIVDDSLTIKVLGTGFQLGRKVGFSVFDSSFGVDFGRLWN
ncbi:hypothetical protein BOX15_Mlig027809g1 [Macrostomum lignano]|uniref:Uncharacterized protein n=1 Tax=Macrostomum lignano TaxID=282301 RepID=A0A267DDK5_9PLAT|nr:hypothetical protein BOX15_Mlig027809g1 [Macrostomum lignano]